MLFDAGTNSPELLVVEFLLWRLSRLNSSHARLYGRHRGIKALNLSVPQGSVYGFLGPNGLWARRRRSVCCCFSGSGSAMILGRDCWQDGQTIKRDIGYLPGDLRLYPWMTGRGAKVGRAGPSDRPDKPGRELADDFGPDLSRKVREMSAGDTAKSSGLCWRWAYAPKLLILDEPTTSLDPIMQQKLLCRLRAMAGNGHTVFFSSHTLSEVDRLCDRVAIVREGELVAEQSLAALRAEAGHWVTVRWKDEASANSAPPAFLKLSQHDGRLWTGELSGPVDRFVSWLSGAGREYEDLSIGPPDLEALFHHYYDGKGDGA
ncbi:MAG: ABC transporter ATP-binding protein [Phycisphaerales bacterium]